jgi:L-malate glycosyltransferase
MDDKGVFSMKILHTAEFYHPSVGGMQEVVKQLSERLVKLGHEVTVATSRLQGRDRGSLNGVQIAEFGITGNLVRGMSGDLEDYRRFVLESGFDIVTNFAAQQWATDALITVLEKVPGRKVFVPTGFSGLHNPLYGHYFSAMKRWMLQYDMNVFLSDRYRDIDFARACGVGNITVIPNGASEEEFSSPSDLDIREMLGIPRDHLLILHVGSHTGFKGHAEAIQIFLRASLMSATLLIAANEVRGGCSVSCKFKEAVFNTWFRGFSDGKQIVIISLPRKETVAAYKAADLFLFPSNIECSPLVLFECMASRTPFLTTDVGNAMEIIDWSRSGMLLPTKKDNKGYSKARVAPSVAILETICRDSESRRQMGARGFVAWQKGFTWGTIAQNYEDMYLRLCEGRDRSP